jgi:branched-chain amino acid transport system ATP-binding protein
MALLEVTELSRHFGGLAAVNKVDLKVEEGEILGLIGPNGAGKSTMLNLIDGTLKVSSGTIRFQGHNITRPPHRGLGWASAESSKERTLQEHDRLRTFWPACI